MAKKCKYLGRLFKFQCYFQPILRGSYLSLDMYLNNVKKNCLVSFFLQYFRMLCCSFSSNKMFLAKRFFEVANLPVNNCNIFAIKPENECKDSSEMQKKNVLLS